MKTRKKVLDAIATRYEITLIDATKTQGFDLTGYDLIGFASGIYYSKFHKSVLQFAENNLPMNKRVFFLYTYGAEKEGKKRFVSYSPFSAPCMTAALFQFVG